MLRRRLMMAQKQAGPPPEDWDIDWKYTDGSPTVAGFKPKGSYRMEPDGFHMCIPSGGFGTTRLYPPTESASKSIMEAIFVPALLDDANVQGFRLILGNGKIGREVRINKTGFCVLINDKQIVTSQVTQGKEHRVRIEFSEATSKTYLDGVLQSEGPEASGVYSSYNRIFQQGFKCETILKALRYKFIER